MVCPYLLVARQTAKALRILEIVAFQHGKNFSIDREIVSAHTLDPGMSLEVLHPSSLYFPVTKGFLSVPDFLLSYLDMEVEVHGGSPHLDLKKLQNWGTKCPLVATPLRS